jgi:hypothetical protein
LVVVVASATAYGLFAGVRTRRGRGDRARDLTLLFLSANVLWVILVGNSLEIGENNRFRMATDPLVLALAMACLGDLRLRRPGTHRS